MKQTIFLLISFMALLFACVNSNNKSGAVETLTVDSSEKPTVDSTKIIPADEFIVFFEKFSKSLLCNNTVTLSDPVLPNLQFGSG